MGIKGTIKDIVIVFVLLIVSTYISFVVTGSIWAGIVILFMYFFVQSKIEKARNKQIEKDKFSQQVLISEKDGSFKYINHSDGSVIYGVPKINK